MMDGVRTKALLRRVAQLPVTVTFTVLLAVVSLDWTALPHSTRDRVVHWSSTNVDRLLTQPFGPMLASAFVVLDRPVVWIALTAVGLAATESRLGWARTLLLVAGGHVVGTLVSEGVVAWRHSRGALPDSALHQVDVGVSYVAVTALTIGLVVVRPWWLKPVPALLLVVAAPGLLGGLRQLDVSAVGHVTAFLFGGITAWVSVVGEHRRLRIHSPRPIRSTQVRQ